MSNLPKTWTKSALGLLIQKIESGLNIKCEERPPGNDEKGLVKISAVTWGRFNQEQSKTLPSNFEVNESTRISAGDLLISRANTIELVGASVIVEKIDKRLYLSDKVLRLVVPEDSKRWINYALKLPTVRKAIEESSSGNQLSMRNISQDKLRSIEIPIAPLAEQKRIADKLDSVLARVDACRERLNRVSLILKRFRQSILAAATSGQLTADWREQSGLKSVQSVSQTTGNTPDGWRKTTIGEIALDLRYGTSKKCSYGIDATAVLRIPNISSQNRIDLSDLKFAQFEEIEKEKLALDAGDILVIRSNGSVDLVGRCAVVTEAEKGLLFAGYLMRLRVDTYRANPDYVANALSAPDMRQRIELTAKSTSGVNNINSEELLSLPISIPPLEEQQEIVRRVKALFSFTENLEARVDAARVTIDRLTPALLAKAFRGELVPQDPNDESATELLKRLASTRAQVPKSRRGNKAAIPLEA